MGELNPRRSAPASDDAAGAEVLAAVKAASLGIRVSGPGVFAPGETDDSVVTDFRHWVTGDFSEVHGRHILWAHSAAVEQGAKEVATVDRGYGELLQSRFPGLVETSAQLGHAVLDALPGAKHTRLTDRLLALRSDGVLAGHWAPMFGVHASVFNVPMTHGLVAFAYHEWKLAGGGKQLPAGVSLEVGFSHAAADARLAVVVAEIVREWQDEAIDLVACA